MDKKLFYILAAMFALRAKHYHEKWQKDDSLGGLWFSAAYDNAFDMLDYALAGDWDCLCQFSWFEEAEEIINKVGTNISLMELEDIIKS